MNTATELCTEAWLLKGIHSIPGALRLADGRLSYTACGFGTFGDSALAKLEAETGHRGLAHRLEQGEEAVLFDTPLANVEKVDFPWYYFSGGVKLTVGGVHYRFGFDRPANTTVPMEVEDSLEELIGGLENVSQIIKGRRSGKAWKSVFQGRRR